MPLVLLERSWWAGFNGNYLVRFGFRMWEILIFKWFLLLKISNKFPKKRVLEGKISWGLGGNTLANGTGHISVNENEKYGNQAPFLKHCFQKRAHSDKQSPWYLSQSFKMLSQCENAQNEWTWKLHAIETCKISLTLKETTTNSL